MPCSLVTWGLSYRISPRQGQGRLLGRCHPRQRVAVGNSSAVGCLHLCCNAGDERCRADVHLATCPRPKIIILAVGDVAVGLAYLLALSFQAEESVSLVVQQFPLVYCPSVQGLSECPLHLVPVLRQAILRLVVRMEANRSTALFGGSHHYLHPAHSCEWPQVVLRIVVCS